MTVTTTVQPDRLRPLLTPDHRRREARAQRPLDARRALGALRPDPADRPRRPSTTRTGTGSCCPRGTGRPPTTPCWPPRASSRRTGSTTSAGWDSPLGHHPDRVLHPRRGDRHRLARARARRSASAPRSGLRAQGFPDARTFVLLGDAELDEGSNHEAIAYAAAIRLPLTAIVIDNQSATHGWPGGIAGRFPGWTRRRSWTAATTTRIERALRRPAPATGRTSSSPPSSRRS